MDTEKYFDYILSETQKILAIDSPSGFTRNVADYVLSAYRALGYEPVQTVYNSLAQVMGSMGLVGIVAYGRLLHDRIALLRQGSRDPFVRILTLSYLGMFLISLCNPGEFCPFPNAALMVMVFAQAEEAVGDVAVPVRQLLARHLGAPAGFLQF